MKESANIHFFSLLLLISLLWIPLSKATSYTIGVEDLNYYPLAEIDERHEYSGFGRALLDAFAAKKGHTFFYIPLPIPRLWLTYFNERVDAKYPDNPSWKADIKKEKKLPIVYSKPVVKFTEGLMVLPTHLGRQELIKKIGTVRGFTPFPYLQAIKEGKILVTEYTELSSALLAARNERVDGVYANIAVALALLHNQGADEGLIFDPSMPKIEDQIYLSSFLHPELIKDFNQFLIEEKAFIEKLKEQFKVEEGLQ